MANVHCYNGYCEPIIENEKETITERALMVGGYLLFVAVLGALVFYGAFLGYYPDMASLS